MHIIASIRDARGLDASEKSVLFALASRCGRGKNAAWPSVPRLADDAGLSVRTTQRVLRRLEQVGWLKVQLNRHGKKNAPSTYTISPQMVVSNTPPSGGVFDTTPGDTVPPQRVNREDT